MQSSACSEKITLDGAEVESEAYHYMIIDLHILKTRTNFKA